ncbi:hypothetical protein scyTo_0002257 [Scyliorhinus torazame]|uniref:Uncharacterized protein n=1 Tax=Scyliorhinus torazame TaxID=75743 RepID=A0A401PIH1_SCYTO|nr:hypothetical protein [Scyliorhinus torazame]
MADRSIDSLALPLEVRAKLAELDLELSEGSEAKEFPRHGCEEARHNGTVLLSKHPTELHPITDNTFVQLDTKSNYNAG